MAEGLNKVMLIGNLGTDPELKFSQAGGAILNISLATNEKWKDKAGEWQEKTEWHRVTLFGNRAEALGKILAKGKSIFVDGRLQTDSYEKDGVKRYATKIIANNIILLGGGESPKAAASKPAETGPDW